MRQRLQLRLRKVVAPLRNGQQNNNVLIFLNDFLCDKSQYNIVQADNKNISEHLLFFPEIYNFLVTDLNFGRVYMYM